MNKDLLEKLYIEQHLSMVAISKELGVTDDKVRWWIDKHGIPLRSKSEQAYLQHNLNNDAYTIKDPKLDSEHFLMGLGLGLYWGEGNKVDEYSVRLGNTDPELIIAFVKFLTQICQVRKDKIKFGLQIFNDIDKDLALSYWMSKLNVGRDSFHKTISVIPPQGKGTYKRKSQYGVVQVYVSDKRLKEWIINKIAEINSHI